MKFLQDLYLSEQIAPKVDKIVKRIEAEKIVPNLYMIVMSSHPDNMLDLIPHWEILQKDYPKESLRVIGFADGKKDAYGLVQSIVLESIEKEGQADVRPYLEKKWEGQL